MKKQVFLEKIGKEIREKDRQNLLKKKLAASIVSTNVEDYLKIDSEEDIAASEI